MLATMVEERIDTLDNHITWTYIAKKLNLSKSTMSKFKNNTNELSFNSAFELCELLYPKTYIEVMASWCSYFKKPANVKFALEFLQLNRFYSFLKDYICELERSTSSPHIKELTAVYSLLLTTTANADPSRLVLPNLAKLSLKLPEALFLSKMCEIYVIHKSSNHLIRIDELLFEAEGHLDKVEDDTLKTRYAVRVAEIKSITSLFVHNDIVSSRDYSKEILDKIDYLCDKLAADSYYRMGMSFFNESPDMCLHYLKKCADKLDKAGLEQEAVNIKLNEVEFVKVHWGIVKTEEELSAPESKAHFHAINSGGGKANEFTSKLNQESPFTLYYKGVADKNAAFLIESALIFKNRANRFYAELPLRLLEGMPGMAGIVTQIRQ